MKIHLRKGSNSILQQITPACQSYGKASVNRVKLSPKIFRDYPDESELCEKCKAVFLKRRNEQRKKHGLEPVERFNEDA